MNRTEATKFLRAQLDAQNLPDWHIRLVTDLTRPYLGLTSYKDKCIILNAHHIDTHGELEVIDTIKHEVAHALCPGHEHDDVWKAKAIELGCTNPVPCVSYSFDERAIDAIRSGATLEVTYEERIVREPKYKITRLQDKCHVCGQVAIEEKRKNFKSNGVNKVAITYKCKHFVIKDADYKFSYEDLIFDGDEKCEHVWGEGIDRTECVKCSARRLFEYQVEGCRNLERHNGRHAIFDDTGLGKTIQVFAYFYYNINEVKPFLWVTKSAVKFQHSKELVRLLGWKNFAQVLMSGKDTLIPGMSVIASYDIFRRLDLQMVIKHGFKVLVLDECQAIANVDSARTGCIRTIAKHIPKIIPLSATPWKNKGTEFFPVLNILDPTNFYSAKAFEDNWVEDVYLPGGKVRKGGIRNPDKFKERYSHLFTRREFAEVMPELPLLTRNKLYCQIPDSAKKVYKEEEDKLIAKFNDFILEGREDSFEANQVLKESLMVMKQIVGIAKVPATLELAEEFLLGTDKKLIIFVQHIKCGEMIYGGLKEFCEKEGLPEPLKIVSSMNDMQREEARVKFNGPNYRVVVASTLATGEGGNFQTCSDTILHERQWNPANEEQAIRGRVLRIGQKSDKVTATYVHAEDSCDTDLEAIVERKRKAFHTTMNKGEMPSIDEHDMVKDLVQAIIDKRRKKVA